MMHNQLHLYRNTPGFSHTLFDSKTNKKYFQMKFFMSNFAHIATEGWLIFKIDPLISTGSVILLHPMNTLFGNKKRVH